MSVCRAEASTWCNDGSVCILSVEFSLIRPMCIYEPASLFKRNHVVSDVIYSCSAIRSSFLAANKVQGLSQLSTMFSSKARTLIELIVEFFASLTRIDRFWSEEFELETQTQTFIKVFLPEFTFANCHMLSVQQAREQVSLIIQRELLQMSKDKQR